MAVSGLLMVIMLRSGLRTRSRSFRLAAGAFIVCLLIAVAATVHHQIGSRSSLDPELAGPDEIRERMRQGGLVLGRHVAGGHARAGVGVIVSPPDGRTAAEEAMLGGLLDALQAGNCAPGIVELSGANATPFAELAPSKDSFDSALMTLADCGTIVSLVGLPVPASGLRFWNRPEQVPLAVANAQILTLGPLIETGKIEALLVRRPWQPGDRLQKGEDVWMVVTASNFAEINRRYPNLFASR